MANSPRNSIAINTTGHITIVTFGQAKLDESNAEPIGQQLQALITGPGGGEVHLDFQGVDYMSSAGLRAIDDLAASLEEQSGSLRVIDPTDPVRLVLDLSGLAERLKNTRQ